MDSVGCALGGAQQHDVHIARKVLGEADQEGPGEDWLTSGRVRGRARAAERGDQDNYW